VDAVSVTAPKGFSAAGVASGIKESGDLDVALVAADAPAVTAAVFTVNQAAAAPVALSREHLERSDSFKAVLLNSGCANAGTGEQGMVDARASVAAVAEHLGCAEDQVLVCSTGGIGKPLPMDRFLAGIGEAASALGAEPGAATAAATAIMTTDSVPKESVRHANGFAVGGMAKGAGMIRPDMATMLVVLTTDAVAGPEELDAALRTAVEESFHALNIDGCPSTNDAVVVMASGESGVAPGQQALAAALSEVCWDLAVRLAADAEGAGRTVIIEVDGAADDETARRAGRIVADSALVRSAFYGGDPNWGRLLGALGASDLKFDPAQFGIAYEGIQIARDGVAADHDAAALHNSILEGDFTVAMTIGTGPGRARVLTTDLTPEYVTFNAEYS
jgi:glutamate N-acetyltransferase/amino-acid N-acetyltransferase